ncbi:hypothetical protein DOTSEDRAFT_72409 [Dothistroma septosporum NZE10]|uniref:CRIB domain-containing protein n=1 Tax=Dothistroma septosporum (strain NZE10 / CBS 128990) TaxID=675120 RepID=M2WLS1_DOTSN|nr:hypothetical protein DOTSEDRAFT_72409 [Dothistroma septosporum NZE10]
MTNKLLAPPDPAGHHFPDDTLRSMDSTAIKGSATGRSWSRGETSSQASRSPESTRRKRLSFFGRSSSEASKESAPSLHSAMSSQNDSRPGTARSESRRRTTDPLESIRNSLLRGRSRLDTDGADGEVNPSRSTSRSVEPSRSRSRRSTSLRSLARFEKPTQKPIEDQEKEYYQYRKKSSISPPFNFQHVTHTARKHLPQLETVDERELKTKFWQLNAYQRPKERLNGIKADDLGNRSRSGSASSAQRPPTPPRNTVPSDHVVTSPQPEVIRSPDETLFDETQETKFSPDDAYTSLEEVNKLDMAQASPTVPAAKHCSSMSALRSPTFGNKTQLLRTSGSFDTTLAPRSPPRSGSRRARTSLPAGQMPRCQAAVEKEEGDGLKKGRLAGQSFREKQPLPAIPQESALRPTLKAHITNVPQRAPSYSLFPSVAAKRTEDQPGCTVSESKRKQPEHALLSETKRSSRFTHVTSTSKSFSSLGTDFLCDSSWEDDIDFAYEQAAEAMCNFDWETASAATSKRTAEDETTSPSVRPSPDILGSGVSSHGRGIRFSAWINRPSAFTSNSSLSTRQTSDTSVHTQASTNSEAPSLNANTQHKRGTSVGHKGFLAARSASTEPLRKSPEFSPQYSSAHAKTPPPKFSLTEADETTDRSTYSPATSTSYFPIIDSTIPEYLSDPESDRPGGARHRKSSSYGSFESSQKSTQSLQTSNDTTRWSSASASSIPDLMHSKRMSRSSIHLRGRVSKPLESVPHSPHAELPEFCNRDSVVQRDSLKIPSNWERASPDPIVMRRPENPGDTSLLLSAGRTVQRDRSTTPSNSRHGSRSNIGDTPSATEEEGGWI